jgi:hypothetical protein
MSKPDKILADKAIGLKEDVATVQLKHTDFILYALGIGFSTGRFGVIEIPIESRILGIPTSTMRISIVSVL